jgi:hypothetical protein
MGIRKTIVCECGNDCFNMLRSKTSNLMVLTDETKRFFDEFVTVIDRPCVKLENLPYSSSQVALWRCTNCSYESSISVGARTKRNDSCPQCVNPEKSLLVLRPDIAQDFVKNITNPNRVPAFLSPGMNDKILLECSFCSHQWISTPSSQSRIKGIRCPICTLKVPEPKKSLNCTCGNNCSQFPILRPAKKGQSVRDLYPELVDELNPIKNGCFSLSYVRTGYSKKVWWVCKNCNNEWEALVSNRARLGVGCPECGNVKSASSQRGVARPPKIGESWSEKHPELVKYWHPTKNGTLLPNQSVTGTSAWWICDRGHTTKSSPGSKMSNLKSNPSVLFPCRDCDPINRAIPKLGNSFGDCFPEFAKYWHPTKNGELTAFDVTPHANTYVFWLCSAGHSTRALVNSKSNGHTCDECQVSCKSKIEDLFRQAFKSEGVLLEVPDGNVRLPIPLRTRLVVNVDIAGVCPSGGLPVVVEYDGEYYHSISDEVIARDVEKTQALLDAGYRVVRIREHALFFVDLSHPNLFQVSHDFAPRIQMRVDENIVFTVNVVRDWLKSNDDS